MSKKKRNTLVVLWTIAIALSLYASYLTFIDCGFAEVCFVDVGQGDSCFIKTERGGNILIDGGDKGTGKYTLKSFLRKYAALKLDAVFISHIHDDHITGIKELMEEGYPIKTIYVSELASQSGGYNKIKSLADNTGAEVVALSEDDVIELDNIIFKVVSSGYKGDGKNGSENDNSLVLRMEYGENSFLFTGDATRRQETQIMGDDDIDTDFLKVGHHGSYTSSGKDFIEEVSPLIAVISVGENNKYDHPSEETISTLDRLGITVMRTDLDGTISIIMTDDDIRNISGSRERSEE